MLKSAITPIDVEMIIAPKPVDAKDKPLNIPTSLEGSFWFAYFCIDGNTGPKASPTIIKKYGSLNIKISPKEIKNRTDENIIVFSSVNFLFNQSVKNLPAVKVIQK